MNFTNLRNWTSFNSGKLFSHIERWKLIEKNKECPPPVLVTVDPSNYCNLSCEWCNAWKIRQNQRMLSKDTLLNFANFISSWKSKDGKYSVEAVCVAGGGEPLCNPYISDFIFEVNRNNIDISTVTNGTLINKYIDALLLNQYVAVSVDAATSTTFNKYKGLDKNSNQFNQIINNMEQLCKIARSKDCNLGKQTRSNGVNYRMLLYKDNIKEISEAARIAQEIGCNSLHIRPAANSYDKNSHVTFTEDDLELFKEQIRIVNERKKHHFGFYYTLGKFNEKFQKNNDFNKCYAIFMTATLMPPINSGNDNSYCLNVCCDRRCDHDMRLLTNENDMQAISAAWGSNNHWKIHDLLSIQQIRETCPRCTYYEHNKIFENCILEDNMLLNFI